MRVLALDYKQHDMGLEHSILMQKQRWSQVCWHIIKTSHPETAKLKTPRFKLVSTFHYMREFSTCFTFQIANTFCSMYMWFFFEGLNQYSNASCVTIKSSFTLSNINSISLYNINSEELQHQIDMRNKLDFRNTQFEPHILTPWNL